MIPCAPIPDSSRSCEKSICHNRGGVFEIPLGVVIRACRELLPDNEAARRTKSFSQLWIAALHYAEIFSGNACGGEHDATSWISRECIYFSCVRARGKHGLGITRGRA